MLLELRDVVRDVVDERHLAGREPEPLPQEFTDRMRDRLSVRPGVIRSGPHGPDVVPSFGTPDRSAGKLAVGEGKPVALRSGLESLDVVRADLVAEAARAAVDHHRDRPGLDPERSCSGRIVDLVHYLELEEVVSGPERSRLGHAPRERLLGDLRGVGLLHPPAPLAPLEVAFNPESLPDGEGRTVLEHAPEVRLPEPLLGPRPDPRRCLLYTSDAAD